MDEMDQRGLEYFEITTGWTIERPERKLTALEKKP